MSHTVVEREHFYCHRANGKVLITRQYEQPESTGEGNLQPIGDPILRHVDCSGKIWCEVGRQSGQASANFNWAKCAHNELKKL